MIKKTFKKFHKRLAAFALVGGLLAISTSCGPPPPQASVIKELTSFNALAISKLGTSGDPQSTYVTLEWQPSGKAMGAGKVDLLRKDGNYSKKGIDLAKTTMQDDSVSTGNDYTYYIRVYDEENNQIAAKETAVNVPSPKDIGEVTLKVPAKDGEKIILGAIARPTFEWSSAGDGSLYYVVVTDKTTSKPVYATLTTKTKITYGDESMITMGNIPDALAEVVPISGESVSPPYIEYGGDLKTSGTIYSIAVKVLSVSPALADGSYDLKKVNSFTVKDAKALSFTIE